MERPRFETIFAFLHFIAPLKMIPSFYTLLSVTPRPNSGERIHIGLLVQGGQRVRFDYSERKLEAAKTLLSEENFRLVKGLLQSLKTELSDGNQLEVFERDFNIWDGEYLSYLNRYNSNLITYSPARKIEIKNSEENFAKLFSKYVSDFNTVEKNTNLIEKRVGNYLKKHLKKRTNIDTELTSDELPGLLYPVRLMSLGRNDAPFVCEALNFEKNVRAVDGDLGNLLNLRLAFEKNSDKNYKLFLIGNEPDKSLIKNHQIWHNVRQSGFVDLIPETEKEKVEEYAEMHNVRPWFSDKKER